MTEIVLPPIQHKVFVAAAPAVVYAAITTSEGLESWLASKATIDAKLGGSVRLVWKNFGPDDLNVEDGGEIVEATFPSIFSFEWHPGSSITKVRFKLNSVAGGTIVDLTETGHQLCDDDVRALVDCSAGWGEALTKLKYYIEHGISHRVHR